MRTTTRRRLAVASTALALTVGLAACADDAGAGAAPAGETSPAATQDGATADADRTDADTRFAQMMIVHHEGALEMADLARERAADPEVRALAERIAAAQGPEIELMSGWLEAWGEDQPDGMDHGGMDHGGMDMDGMDQGQAMEHMTGFEGTEFDRAFLELMIAHHEGAVEMAQDQLADGADPAALELARDVVDAQTAEIAEMQEMLAGL